MIKELLRQMFKKPATNTFPVKYIPKNVTKALATIGAGKVKITPPVAVPEKFRGALKYYKDKCIGCQLCIKVCPCAALEFNPETRKVDYHVSRCCFCAQCVDICPVKALESTDKFMLSSYDKKGSWAEVVEGKEEVKNEKKND
ncbi:MAG: 4Fe-4S binding protein [archaeon]